MRRNRPGAIVRDVREKEQPNRIRLRNVLTQIEESENLDLREAIGHSGASELDGMFTGRMPRP